MYSYKYPHPAVTVDCVILGSGGETLKILLVQRRNEPFKGRWALPGGFVEIEEDLPDAALRELKEETGISHANVTQIGAYGKPGRDPRERVISIAYMASVEISSDPLKAGSDAQAAEWFSIESLPELAFDHELIITDALQKQGPQQ